MRILLHLLILHLIQPVEPAVFFVVLVLVKLVLPDARGIFLEKFEQQPHELLAELLLVVLFELLRVEPQRCGHYLHKLGGL